MGRTHSALALVGLLGCGEPVVVEHGQIGEIDDPGNFPEPAISRCGELPEGVEPVPGLTAAWAVLALPGATDTDGEAVPTGGVRLRLADHAIEDCAGAFFDPFECDGLRCKWGLSIAINEAPVVSSFVDLARLPEADFEVAVIDGLGPAIVPGRGGTLVLHRVTSDCVVGELRDVETTDGIPRDGGFVAELCQRQCIPSQLDGGC